MASAMVKGICRACQLSLRRLQIPTGASTPVTRRGFKSALPPADEIPEEELADYEVSKEEFKYAERLLSRTTVPPMPQHESYPTPSGWVAPKDSATSLPYFVRRSKNHMLPIYEKFTNGNTRQLVTISHIDGDIWAFDSDLRKYLQDVSGNKIIPSQVHELGGYIRVKGRYAENICQFLLDRGF